MTNFSTSFAPSPLNRALGDVIRPAKAAFVLTRTPLKRILGDRGRRFAGRLPATLHPAFELGATSHARPRHRENRGLHGPVPPGVSARRRAVGPRAELVG